MELGIDLRQKQTLSQHLVQSMEILQMSTLELEDYIQNLALENPLIDLPESASSEYPGQDDLKRKMEWLESTDIQNKVYYQQDRNSDNAQENWQENPAPKETLSESLFSQIMIKDYSKEQRAIMGYLILSLDSRGYFTDDITATAEYLSVPEQDVLDMLKELKSLEPAGVGAADLQECLLLQLYRRESFSPLTETLIRYHMSDIAKKHLHIIARKLSVSLEEITDACLEIQSLNPRPGNSYGTREQFRYITPDILIIKLTDEFEILINEYQYPNFTINSYYQDLLKSTTDAEAKKYLQEKLAQAQWVQSCITGRTSTLSRVMHALVQRQCDFFLYGPGHKRPMKLSDLADDLKVHESTVSRALRGKYLQCSWGIFPLNYFLTSTAATAYDGSDEKTPDQIKALLQELIQNEDKNKPLSDQALSDALKRRGIPLSRRTVNKYRTEMGIPDKSGRKIH